MTSSFGWSISSLNAINQCGHLWKLRYQTDIEPEQGRDLPAFAFGRAVHKMIEEIHLRGYWDVVQWSRLWDELWADYSKDVNWDNYPGRQRNYDRLGSTILAAYTESDDNRLAEIECLEQRFELDLEGIPVKGVIDQIRRTNGGLLLLDFKTSKEPSHPLVERTDPQLTLYAHVCRLLYDQIPRVGHYYLRTGSLIETDRNEEDIEMVLNMMKEAQRRVDEGMLTRQLGWHCNECIYRGPCLGQFAA